MKTLETDFIATVTYLKGEDGGRKTPAYSGYRPDIKFEGREELTCGQQIFIGRKFINPGETSEVEITILGVEAFQNFLYEGMKFNFWEGPHLIGSGVINKILNKKLERQIN